MVSICGLVVLPTTPALLLCMEVARFVEAKECMQKGGR